MASERFPERRKRYHVLLSSFTAQEKALLAGTIQNLGGTYLDSPHFIRSCTHIICGKPNRGEKFLCGCASDKWILRKEYIMDSAKAGQWLDEVTYEWSEQCIVDGVSASHLTAPSRWRRVPGQKKGPFEGWKALVAVADAKRRAAYKRLLEAGGAVLVNGKPPYPACLATKLTHVFVEKVLESDVQALKDAGVPCLSPDYIPEFILQEPAPSPEAFLVTVYNPPVNHQECANLKRAMKGAKNTPVLGNAAEGVGRSMSRVEHKNKPSPMSRKQDVVPLCTSLSKKRKQEENCFVDSCCVDRWKALSTFKPVLRYEDAKVPAAEFPSCIVDTIESYLEESHQSAVLDVISSFLSSRRFPPSSLLRTVVESLLLLLELLRFQTKLRDASRPVKKYADSSSIHVQL